MEADRATHVRVVVVTEDHEATLVDCLDGLAAEARGSVGVEVSVVVVDLVSSDASADLAIRHPLPERVAVTVGGDLDRVLDVGSDHTTPLVIVLGAGLRPAPGWLGATLDALCSADVVVGRGQPEGRWDRHLGIDRRRVGHLSMAAEDAGALCRRVHAAGGRTAVPPGMCVDLARPAAWRPDRLPTLPPPPAAARHAGLVSVVVCTRDRRDQLARCLRSLAALSDEDHEILVIDNHEVPSVDPGALPRSARVVHEPRRGLDVARNRGWREAAGDVVAYVDDDCEVDPHWLAGIRAGFADPSVRVVTGRVRAASLTLPSERWFEAHFSFDRGTRPQRFTPWDRRPWYPLWAGVIGAGCNMAFRREALAALGGFDEDLDMGTAIGGGGDLDAFMRVLDHQGLMSYRPDALVWHRHRATERQVTRQFFGYGVAVGALLAKSVLQRPGRRTAASRFYLDRLRVAVRLGRAARAGTHVLPLRLVLVDVLGQLVGPAVYLATRSPSGHRTRATPPPAP